MPSRPGKNRGDPCHFYPHLLIPNPLEPAPWQNPPDIMVGHPDQRRAMSGPTTTFVAVAKLGGKYAEPGAYRALQGGGVRVGCTLRHMASFHVKQMSNRWKRV